MSSEDVDLPLDGDTALSPYKNDHREWHYAYQQWMNKKYQAYDMKEANESKTVLVAKDWGEDVQGAKKFACVPSYEMMAADVVAHFKNGRPLSLYEMIAPDQGSKVYFDVDCEPQDHPDDFAQWRAEPDQFLKEVLLPSLIDFMTNRFDLDLETDDFLVAEAHKPTKLSFHLTLPYRLQDQAARELFKAHLVEHRLAAQAEEVDLFRFKGMPDSAVYSTDQNYRMLLCSKAGKRNALRPLRREWLGEWPEEPIEQFVAFLVQHDIDDLTDLKPIVELKGTKRKVAIAKAQVQLASGVPRSRTLGRQAEGPKEQACWDQATKLLDDGECEQLVNDPGEAIEIRCRPNGRRTCAHGHDCSTNTFYMHFTERRKGKIEVCVLCPGFLETPCANTTSDVLDTFEFREPEVPMEMYKYQDRESGKVGCRPLDHPDAPQTKAGFWEKGGSGVVVDASACGGGKTTQMLRVFAKYFGLGPSADELAKRVADLEAAGADAKSREQLAHLQQFFTKAVAHDNPTPPTTPPSDLQPAGVFADQSILVVFHRVLLGKEIFGLVEALLVEMGFVWYDGKKHLGDERRVFCCIDSLHRLEGTHFDCIWIDEIPEALKTIAVKGQEKKAVIKSWRVLRELCSTVHRLFLTSADAGKLADKHFRKMAPHLEHHWMKSAHKPFDGHVLKQIHTADRLGAVNVLLEPLQQDKHISVLFTEKGDCKDFAKQIAEKLPRKRVWILTGDEALESYQGITRKMSRTDMLDKLRATEDDAVKPDYLGYTSTIGEGCSINVRGWYHRQYVVANVRTLDQEQTAQGGHRIRHPIESEVTLVCLPGATDFSEDGWPGFQVSDLEASDAKLGDDVKDLTVLYPNEAKSVKASLELLRRERATLRDPYYITKAHKKGVVVLERKSEPRRVSRVEVVNRLTFAGRMNQVALDALERGAALPGGVPALALSLNANMASNLDPHNAAWLELAIDVEERVANNRGSFVAGYLTHQRAQGYVVETEYIEACEGQKADRKALARFKKEREAEKHAEVLVAQVLSVEKFVELSQYASLTSDAQACKVRTYAAATYGEDLALNTKNVNRATDRKRQEAYRFGCGVALMIEETKGDEKSVLKKLREESVRLYNDAFLTDRNHQAAVLGAITDFGTIVGLSLTEILDGMWPDDLSLEQELELREAWKQYRKTTGARANREQVGEGGATAKQLLRTVHNIIQTNLGVPSGPDTKVGMPEVSAEQGRSYQAWYEATHDVDEGAKPESTIADDVMGLSMKQRSLWGPTDALLQSKGELGTFVRMIGDEPGPCTDKRHMGGSICEITCLANGTGWVCPHGKTADVSQFVVKLFRSEDGTKVDVDLSCATHDGCDKCTGETRHIMGSFAYVPPTLDFVQTERTTSKRLPISVSQTPGQVVKRIRTDDVPARSRCEAGCPDGAQCMCAQTRGLVNRG